MAYRYDSLAQLSLKNICDPNAHETQSDADLFSCGCLYHWLCPFREQMFHRKLFRIIIFKQNPFVDLISSSIVSSEHFLRDFAHRLLTTLRVLFNGSKTVAIGVFPTERRIKQHFRRFNRAYRNGIPLPHSTSNVNWIGNHRELNGLNTCSGEFYLDKCRIYNLLPTI